MGVLIIDHTQGQGIDGRQGTREEYDTLHCKHCGRLIARLTRVAGNSDAVHHLANIDIGRATPLIHDLPSTHNCKPTCAKCGHAYICRICAKLMEENGGECPGPFEERLELAKATGAPILDTMLKPHDYGKTSYAARGSGF